MNRFKKKSPPVKITMNLISKYCLSSQDLLSLSEDERIDKVIQLSEINLEWSNIEKIDNLEVFDKLDTLYLQYNNIRVIENLELNHKLEFLALQGNRIEKIQNLRALKNLMFLDLSYNLIKTIDISQLPQSLVMLKLIKNPCTQEEDYRKKTILGLNNLDELDCVSISAGERLFYEGKIKDSKILSIIQKNIETALKKSMSTLEEDYKNAIANVNQKLEKQEKIDRETNDREFANISEIEMLKKETQKILGNSKQKAQILKTENQKRLIEIEKKFEQLRFEKALNYNI